MKDVIGNILEIEKKAGEIIEEGKKEKIRLEGIMRQDIEKMQENMNAMVSAKLEQLYLKDKEEAEQSLKRINETADKRLKTMDDFYKENKDGWVDAVFNKITGSEESGS